MEGRGTAIPRLCRARGGGVGIGLVGGARLHHEMDHRTRLGDDGAAGGGGVFIARTHVPPGEGGKSHVEKHGRVA